MTRTDAILTAVRAGLDELGSLETVRGLQTVTVIVRFSATSGDAFRVLCRREVEREVGEP